MKISSYILAFVFLLLSCTNNPFKNDKESEESNRKKDIKIKKDKLANNDLTKKKLNGSVKFMKEESMAEGGKMISTYIFNEAGNILSNTIYDMDGKLWSKLVYHYKKNKLEHCLVFKDSINLDDRGCKRIFSYDSKGNEIEQLWYNRDESLQTQIISHYDSLNNLSEVITIEKKMKNAFEKFKYKYDVEKHLIESSKYNSEKYGESLNFKDKYEYDTLGRMIINWHYGEKESLRVKFIYEYDNFGNQTQVKLFSKEGELFRTLNYKYIYDVNGNWTKCYYYSNDALTDSLKREFVYW